MAVLVVVEDTFGEAVNELAIALVLNKLPELAKVVVERLEKTVIRLGMEKFAPMDPIVVRLQNPLDFFGGLIDIFEVMFPCEMDAERVSMLEGTERNEVHLDTADLGNLHIIFKLVVFVVKVKQCI